ncbi:cellulose biosynthesis protein BcsQ [Cupriavidus sp. AU9028]|uniref:cellulose biosynthesis protein BcsQ n=1 Tax=Cupriavidus sp. AU9028 TaxID=2871157 RepID=UPI001C93E59C|nr:cellulose biosynthesis protein BcsQ [Cupriavidus sp. AU9028]MBY4896300.1 cellulose synthase operon protein YhjQ [Cupriavidus sp. AU9028]
MKTIAIVAPLGGAGRTTMTAALSSLLAARGHAALALECDPRNLLGLHFGMAEPPVSGLVTAIHGNAGGDWARAGMCSDDGVLFVPWGDGMSLGAEGDNATVRELLARPQWLHERLAQVDLPEDAVALIDTPAWPAPQVTLALAAADLALVLVPPEPEACATLARLRQALRLADVPAVFVATRVQAARQLHADVLALLRATLGDALLPYQVHLDVGVPEALARGENFCSSTPHSQAAHDMQGIAAWLSRWIAERVVAETASRAETRRGARA